MKIVHICQYYNDGFGYQENLLPKYQKKLGNDVVVITSDRRSYFAGEKVPKIVGTGQFEDNGVRIERLKISGEFKGRHVRFSNLTMHLESEKPDYIFHHGLTAPSLIEAAKYKQNHPSVLLVADNHADYNNSGRNKLWLNIFYRSLWRSKLSSIIDVINVFFSVTPGCMLFAENELAIPKEKHRLLYLGADIDTNHFSKKWREIIRNDLGFSSTDFVIITAGKIDRAKNTDKIIRALEIANSKCLKLMIVGSIEKDYEKFMDSLIVDHSRIIKLGWIEADKLYRYFSAADIAVFPGGQSAIWQQAISCELPVILRYHPGTEYMLYENNGLFLFSEDPRELAQYIAFLAEDGEKIESMRANAIKLVEGCLSYDRVAIQSIEPVEKMHM
jgi:glycosyltransferase involved in cell wall biosynthesis